MLIQKSDITLPVNDTLAKAYLAMPEDGGPGVLVLHAWWGLKPFFKQLCNQLAEQGLIAIAPDLRNGEIAATIDDAKALMEKSDGQLVGDIVMAAKDYLRALPQLRGGKIGVIGFSMGAGWALIVASHKPEQIAATVLFYGVDIVDFGKIQSKVLGHYSDVDEWEPLDGIQTMERDMRAAGVDVTIHVYPGQAHWFVESDRPEYDAASAQLAWDRTSDFLKENL